MRIMSSISPERSLQLRSLSRDQMNYMFGDFEKIIEGLMRSKYEGSTSFQPKCDVCETKDHYLATFDIPGVKKEDIKIEIQGNQMVVSGERKNEIKESHNEINIYNEILHGKFERTFNLPMTVDSEKIEAQHENGVLTIAIPKAVKNGGKTIEIQSGQESFLNKILGSKKDPNKELRDVKVS